ncbi:Gfo/Idh/MocA family protein [Alkalihalobacillus sp. 1P02AB]|uniref:Gfo/Idh/MocA family protein n=1 Tax=Alkalihalobacillus sp. 1P02AB TaxID=3132260 RepID=UPI0039A68B42
MINVALLSKWHVHAGQYAEQALSNEQVSVKVVWDEDEVRGKEWAEELGVPFERDLDIVLANPQIDAVIVDTPTNLHKEIIILAAKQKKHIFTEKVLAFTIEDCEEIYQTVQENKVKFMISLPRLNESYYLYAEEVVDKGLLGEISMVRCRLAHNGAVPTESHPNGWLPKHFFNAEQCGGGAFIDLGAHPIYLTNRLAGEATAVTARLKQTSNHQVDVNSTVMVDYQSGAIGVLETSFLSGASPFQLEVYGTEGTLLIEDEAIRIKSSQLGEEWIVPSDIPEPLPLALNQWVNSIISNDEPNIKYEDAFNLTLINQAASLSNQEGRRVEINEIVQQSERVK